MTDHPRPRDYALAILQAPNRAERQAILAQAPEPWRALVSYRHLKEGGLPVVSPVPLGSTTRASGPTDEGPFRRRLATPESQGIKAPVHLQYSLGKYLKVQTIVNGAFPRCLKSAAPCARYAEILVEALWPKRHWGQAEQTP